MARIIKSTQEFPHSSPMQLIAAGVTETTSAAVATLPVESNGIDPDISSTSVVGGLAFGTGNIAAFAFVGVGNDNDRVDFRIYLAYPILGASSDIVGFAMSQASAGDALLGTDTLGATIAAIDATLTSATKIADAFTASPTETIPDNTIRGAAGSTVDNEDTQIWVVPRCGASHVMVDVVRNGSATPTSVGVFGCVGTQ